ncbi:hypothetical protein [Thalassobacillus sp. CUG 92003]|uniref:hypothetical protein n=1 Tax=Thalassobacillus sp. CUG 92003 TaxID=2736641 RepID=UPI0015E67046|nr:hypothetical protein [Thalassobacillus sp. CUG 92003]
MKKQVSVRIEDTLNDEVEQRAKELGISKSAFISFSTQFFLHQLNYSESSSSAQHNFYELIKANLETQYQNS